MDHTTAPREVKYLTKVIPFYPRPFSTLPTAGARMTVQAALERIRDGKWKAVIERLRAEKDEKKQKALKKELGALVFGFNFPARRPREYESATDRLQCSWLVTLDYDGVADPKAVRKKASRHPAVVGAFISPRGNGVKVLVAWRGKFGPEGYTGAWRAAARLLDKVAGSKADPNGKDLTRICYPSYDPGCYIAPADKEIEPVWPVIDSAGDPLLAARVGPIEEDEEPGDALAALRKLEWEDKLSKVRERLMWIDPAFSGGGKDIAPGVTNDRDGWIKTCFAVVATLGHRESTKALLLSWSRGELVHPEAKHEDGVPDSYGTDKDFEVAWKSFSKKPHGRPAGLGSLTNTAKACGWSMAHRERTGTDAEEWEESLLRSEHGAVKLAHVNAKLIMEKVTGVSGLLRWNELRAVVEWTGQPPYKRTSKEEVWMGTDALDMACWLSNMYKVTWNPSMIDEVVSGVARLRSYHPVRDYLGGLEWDGKARLDGWLAGAFGVKPSAYSKAVGRKWMISAVARAMRPGCKVDTMLILEGFQGTKKSSGFRALAGEKWFSDAQLIIGDKDGMLLIQKVWIHELPEMHTYRKAEADLMKSFLSRQTDEFREPYGRVVVERPRGVVFVGTTNESKYLKDPTGNRRFWPVAGTKVAVKWIRDNRDQLWAEAKAAFDSGEKWWLEDIEEDVAKAEQGKRMEADPWEDTLIGYLDRSDSEVVSSGELLNMALELKNPSTADARRLAAAMRKLGWEGPRKVSINKSQVNGFQLSG